MTVTELIISLRERKTIKMGQHTITSAGKFGYCLLDGRKVSLAHLQEYHWQDFATAKEELTR